MLGERIGLKDYSGRICFYPTTHMIFQVVQLHQEIVMSGLLNTVG